MCSLIHSPWMYKKTNLDNPQLMISHLATFWRQTPKSYLQPDFKVTAAAASPWSFTVTTNYGDAATLSPCLFPPPSQPCWVPTRLELSSHPESHPGKPQAGCRSQEVAAACRLGLASYPTTQLPGTCRPWPASQPAPGPFLPFYFLQLLREVPDL